MIIWNSETDASKPTHAQYLTLRRGPDGWIVDWSGTTRANEIRALFGSCLVPTPYTFLADRVEVYTAIKALNPEYLIHVAH